MYTLRREYAFDDEARYDLVDSLNKPLMTCVYPVRIALVYSLADEPAVNVLSGECELVTEWFSLGLVR